eukprot:UN09097
MAKLSKSNEPKSKDSSITPDSNVSSIFSWLSNFAFYWFCRNWCHDRSRCGHRCICGDGAVVGVSVGFGELVGHLFFLFWGICLFRS